MITLEDDADTFQVQPFAISKYPVTWAQYCSFLQATDGYRNVDWWQGLAERETEPGEQYRQQDNHPAENVGCVPPFTHGVSTRPMRLMEPGVIRAIPDVRFHASSETPCR